MPKLNFTFFETERIDFVVFNSPIVSPDDFSQIDEINSAIDKYNINIIFRLCESLYPIDAIYCDVIDMQIQDGSFPTNNVIDEFLETINQIIQSKPNNSAKLKSCVGLHCRAGLGRAPIFAAIGLMNYGNFNSYIEVVDIIRGKIHKSINLAQLNGISIYKPKYRAKNTKCTIM